MHQHSASLVFPKRNSIRFPSPVLYFTHNFSRQRCTRIYALRALMRFSRRQLSNHSMLLQWQTTKSMAKALKPTFKLNYNENFNILYLKTDFPKRCPQSSAVVVIIVIVVTVVVIAITRKNKQWCVLLSMATNQVGKLYESGKNYNSFRLTALI